ncbi:MAG: hypothetical protein LBC02_06725 [Planctomycetaceae bacterium]|nr:hypothetical protein [Planctomycetaceae bacterium]
MFRRNIAVGDSRLTPVFGRKFDTNRLATQIAVRTQGHCRLAPTNLSAKGCYHLVALSHLSLLSLHQKL